MNNSNVLEKGVDNMEPLDGILYPQTDLETYNELIKNADSFKKKAD